MIQEKIKILQKGDIFLGRAVLSEYHRVSSLSMNVTKAVLDEKTKLTIVNHSNIKQLVSKFRGNNSVCF